MNQLIITGRIGQDPVLRYTPSQKAVLNLSVATDVGFGDNKKTQWVSVTIWEKRAEALAQYLAKGDMISCSGQATARAWINQQTNEAQASIEMNANQVTLCGGGQGGGQQQQRQPQQQPQQQQRPAQQPAQDFNDFDDDIPF